MVLPFGRVVAALAAFSHQPNAAASKFLEPSLEKKKVVGLHEWRNTPGRVLASLATKEIGEGKCRPPLIRAPPLWGMLVWKAAALLNVIDVFDRDTDSYEINAILASLNIALLSLTLHHYLHPLTFCRPRLGRQQFHSQPSWPFPSAFSSTSSPCSVASSSP